MEGRKAFSAEINAQYQQVAISRIQAELDRLKSAA